ncbi:MAG: CPBP family intramembrane glutamic endopeptidase [Candidatus Altiarchaeota archaeon]|nr:CPBP family intramembrane glutamic endopeptidase [Candidatus Altiarchaeota archaeon]
MNTDDSRDNWDKKFAGINLRVVVPLFAYVLVGSAELTSTYLDVRVGILIHLLFLFTLLILSSLLYRESIRTRSHSLRKAWQIEDMSYLLNALILIPLIGLIRFSMPLEAVERIYWFSIIGIPLFLAIILLIRHMKMQLRDVGLVSNFSLTQFFIALTGVLFGFCEYLILKPVLSEGMILKPGVFIDELTPINLAISCFILMIFSGLLEELTFRGIVQTKAEAVVGRNAGLFLSSILFMLMHIGFKSTPDMIFVFLVGFFYGYVFQKTRSLWGITLSHGITNIVLFLIAPFFFS